jgi:hypothetical protein
MGAVFFAISGEKPVGMGLSELDELEEDLGGDHATGLVGEPLAIGNVEGLRKERSAVSAEAFNPNGSNALGQAGAKCIPIKGIGAASQGEISR